MVLRTHGARRWRTPRRWWRSRGGQRAARASVGIFDHVSREFRTWLTLVAAPIEDALDDNTLSEDTRAWLELARANAQKLTKLVDAVADLSRLDQGTITPVYEELDLAAFTTDLASAFRSAVERAGLKFVVDVPAAATPTYVDRYVWEKIVLNLLSNALKFTFEGEIRLALRVDDTRVELSVEDTGGGIPEDEVPHLGERFHRVRTTRSRSQEGIGIGLALVKELAALHGGDLRAFSTEGRGSLFVVRTPRVPRGAPEAVPGADGNALPPRGTARGVALYVDEAMRWLQKERRGDAGHASPSAAKAHILVADDNEDVRRYITRLLSSHWSVTAVPNGFLALCAAREHKPDLILSDVMMPVMDGLELLRTVRSDPGLRTTPFILLTARAGAESTIEGVLAGADDYLAKPFSSRELVARLRTHLHLASVRHQVELEQEAAVAEAERLNRLKDEFLATASHELRTPLQAILGWAQLLSLRPIDEERLSKGLQVIERNARAQAKLIEDILDVSRIINGKIRLQQAPVDVSAVVRGAIDTVRPTVLAKSVELASSVEDALGPVLGDAGRLQQVVWNLLSNAVKFTPEGGRIHIAAARRNGDVELRIKDTGEGIKKEFLPFVFERFRQADGATTRAQGGLGLGLAIVKHIVELHGGTVSAESAGPGQGSTFVVRLPRMLRSRLPNADPGAEGAISGTFSTDGVALLDGRRILVVDDETDAREALLATLAHHGAAARGAGSATEALELFDAFRPEVVISDIAMPYEDGYTFVRRLRERETATGRGGVLAIALSAYARREDRMRAIEAGYQLHLSKPIEPTELVLALRRLLAATPRTRRADGSETPVDPAA